MKAQATAVTEQPAAVILVISSTPLETFRTLLPSVICTPTELQLHSGTKQARLCACTEQSLTAADHNHFRELH